MGALPRNAEVRLSPALQIPLVPVAFLGLGGFRSPTRLSLYPGRVLGALPVGISCLVVAGEGGTDLR